MYDIVCDKFYIQPYWGTIGSMKLNVLQLQLLIYVGCELQCFVSGQRTAFV
jgi:hypothetical protein